MRQSWLVWVVAAAVSGSETLAFRYHGPRVAGTVAGLTDGRFGVAWSSPHAGVVDASGGHAGPLTVRLSTATPNDVGSDTTADSATATDGVVTELMGKEEYEQQVGEDAIGEGELTIIKFWAPWCRACKGLEPKYKRIAEQYPSFRFLAMNWEENRNFCKEIGVQALPMVKMYTTGGEVESFPCGPKKVELLRAKLDEWKSQLQPSLDQPAADGALDGAASLEVEDVPSKGLPSTALRELVMPLFANLTEAQLDDLLDRAAITSYVDGDLLIEQGDSGTRLFVTLSGEVEVFKRDGYGGLAERTPWGMPVNRLGPGQYFGEHALLTGQPRWASVVAASPNVRCLAFLKTDLEAVDPVTWGMGTEFRPAVWGIEAETYEAGALKKPAPAPVVSERSSGTLIETTGVPTVERTGLPMLVRFKLLRASVRAFDFCRRRTPKYGDRDLLQFRRSLVNALTEGQLMEFKSAFALFDRDGNGHIDLEEIKKTLSLQAVGSKDFRLMSDEDFVEMINKANPNVDGNHILTEDDFVAMMAEAEYNEFFREAFAALDERGDGLIEASQITEMMRDFNVENDVMSDIKLMKLMETFDIGEEGHVDYEAFVNLIMSTSD